MKSRQRNSIVLALLSIFFITPFSFAVETVEIDQIRAKPVLTDSDNQQIEQFVSQSVEKMVKAKDLNGIADIRTGLSSRQDSSVDGAKAQYRKQFVESARKYIGNGFQDTAKLADEHNRFIVSLNLLILTDSLEDAGLADIALERVGDANKVINYWAVHSVTNKGVIGQLNSGQAAADTAKKISERLKTIIKTSPPETVMLIAGFGANLKMPIGQEILLEVGDMRISRYMDWTVKDELLDGTLLSLLYEKMNQGGDKKAVGMRFGQLYSCAMQRYIADINSGDDGEGGFLSEAAKQQLASVLVDVEYNYIGKVLGLKQEVIKTAIEKGDSERLAAEHNRLLGNSGQAGELSSKMGFDYGKNDDGTVRLSPKLLPKRPG